MYTCDVFKKYVSLNLVDAVHIAALNGITKTLTFVEKLTIL